MLSMPDAGRFLDLLAGDEPVTFQTFDDSRVKRKPLNKVLHGALDRHGDTLQSLNDRGAGVFVMVNAGDLKGRKADNVQRVRAVFVDLDGAPVEPVLAGPLQPHVVIQSSPGKYHAYWLTDGLPCGEFRAVQEMLAQKFNGDPVVKDLSRVMRLPGYLHQKGEPYLTHILHESSGRYSRGELLDAFSFDPTVSDWRDRQTIPEGLRNTTLFSMARGFVNKGFAFPQILERMTAINEKRCRPALRDTELHDIIGQAMNYGADGSLSIEYSMMDSPEYKALTPMARALDLCIRRIANGSAEASISLRPEDMDQWGFGNSKTLAKYRNELLNSGALICHRPPRFGKQGETRECGLYRLAAPDFYGRTCHKGG